MRKLLGSRGRPWPASAPVGVPVESWKFAWSWKLLGSGRELGAGHENGSWILINIKLTLELETLT